MMINIVGVSNSLIQMPRHFRIAGIWKPEVMEDGLRRLEAALKDSFL